MRMILTGLVCIFSLFVMGCSEVTPTSTEQMGIDLNLSENEVAYTYFDLTSGEATLIQSGKDGNVLIGTGEKSSEQELAKRLKMFHVDTIDSLVIINNQPEYIGNLEWILNHFTVRNIFVPSEIEKEITKRFMLENGVVVGWSNGDKQEILPGLFTEVLYAGEHGAFETGFVLSFMYGDQRTLYMGVADEEMERNLIEDFYLKSAILKVAEFGSPLGTSKAFLEEVDPQVAILFQKEGSLPSETVLERLQETWIDIYQTNKNGTVTIKFTESDYEILTVHLDEQQKRFSLWKK